VLRALLQAWAAGQSAPLPVAQATALAWLAEGGDAAQQAADALAAATGQPPAGPPAEDPARDAALQAYDGSFGRPGEAERDPCLRRLWPEGEDLLQADGGAFAAWAQALYGPLLAWACTPGALVVALHGASDASSPAEA
jgi:exonuclease V gamma subunit